MYWRHTPPAAAGYYWLRCPGYEHGIIVWVFIGAERKLVIDRPIYRAIADVEGMWAGPIPEPEWE